MVKIGNAAYDSSLVKNCYRLRRVPLKHFRIEDLRLMIGQEIGLKYLLPIALVDATLKANLNSFD